MRIEKMKDRFNFRTKFGKQQVTPIEKQDENPDEVQMEDKRIIPIIIISGC